MRIQIIHLAICMLALVLFGMIGGCNSSSPNTADQNSSLDNYQDARIQKLGDDSKDFDPDGFMGGFNGSPGH